MVALLVVKRVGNRESIENENKVMDRIEDFVWDAIAEIRSTKQNENGSDDSVSCAHYLRCELGTKCLIAIRTQQAKEGKEEDC